MKPRMRRITLLPAAMWNVTTFTNQETEIILEMKEHHIDICSLSETKTEGQREHQHARSHSKNQIVVNHMHIIN